MGWSLLLTFSECDETETTDGSVGMNRTVVFDEEHRRYHQTDSTWLQYCCCQGNQAKIVPCTLAATH